MTRHSWSDVHSTPGVVSGPCPIKNLRIGGARTTYANLDTFWREVQRGVMIWECELGVDVDKFLDDLYFHLADDICSRAVIIWYDYCTISVQLLYYFGPITVLFYYTYNTVYTYCTIASSVLMVKIDCESPDSSDYPSTISVSREKYFVGFSISAVCT